MLASSAPVSTVMHRSTVSVRPDTPLQQVAETLAREEVGAVVVTGANGLVGIVSERDVVRQLQEIGADLWAYEPTELLAEQHFLTISEMLKGSGVRLRLFTGAVTGAERDAALASIASGETDIVVGTHALLTETVRFNSLAVAVIDSCLTASSHCGSSPDCDATAASSSRRSSTIVVADVH